MKLFKIFSVIAALFLSGCKADAADPAIDVIPPVEFQSRLAGDSAAYLLDVRRPDEFAAGHLQGAHLLNWLDAENFKKEAVKIDKSSTIYIYCRSGRRSNEAATYLSQQGYSVVDMAGGILAWQKAALPLSTDD